MIITRQQWLDLNEAALRQQIAIYERQGQPLTKQQIQERRDYFENAEWTIEAVAAPL